MYGVMSVKITSDTTGEAIVNLDGYHVFTSFDFELEPDYNGQLGSDTKAVFIKNLAVDRVLLANGGFYNDFTNADDIRNMISVITAHIEKNKMVEAIYWKRKASLPHSASSLLAMILVAITFA